MPTVKEPYTKNCIVCGKEADRWTGHVHLNAETLLAGFCSQECQDQAISVNCSDFQAGCYGQWKSEMGRIDWE